MPLLHHTQDVRVCHNLFCFQVTIRDIDENAMELLIDFCYTSSITVEESNVQTLLPAACLLQLAEIQVCVCECVCVCVCASVCVQPCAHTRELVSFCVKFIPCLQSSSKYDRLKRGCSRLSMSWLCSVSAGRVLRVSEAAARPVQLPRYPRLRRHARVQRPAAHRRQVYATQLPRGQSGCMP